MVKRSITKTMGPSEITFQEALLQTRCQCAEAEWRGPELGFCEGWKVSAQPALWRNPEGSWELARKFKRAVMIGPNVLVAKSPAPAKDSWWIPMQNSLASICSAPSFFPHRFQPLQLSITLISASSAKWNHCFYLSPSSCIAASKQPQKECWGTLWTQLVSFPSLNDHSSALYVVQSLKTVAPYILSGFIIVLAGEQD